MPCMPVFGVCMFELSVYAHNPESREYTEDFTDYTLKKEMVVLETHHGYAGFVRDEGCRF